MNDAASTKQHVNPSTGMVVLASNRNAKQYWFSDDPEFRTTDLRADFTAADRAAMFVPHQVTFVNRSLGRPVSWSWDFGDGSPPSTDPSPSHTYQSAGTFTVRLTVADGVTSHTLAMENYITTGSGTAPDTTRRTAVGKRNQPLLLVALGAVLLLGVLALFRLQKRMFPPHTRAPANTAYAAFVTSEHTTVCTATLHDGTSGEFRFWPETPGLRPA